MNRNLLLRALAVSLLAISPTVLAANKASNDYTACSAECVKSLPWRNFQDACQAGQPMCVYFYDQNNKRNSMAKLLEGGTLLGNADVAAKLKGFLFLKIRADGTDGKGWPSNWTCLAGKQAALVLTTSDGANPIIYHKDMPKEAITSQALLGAIAGILKYEERRKEMIAKGQIAAPAAAKKAEPPPPPAEKTERDLLGLNSKKKEDEKKEKRKTPDGPVEE
jgi:hypothetical protein